MLPSDSQGGNSIMRRVTRYAIEVQHPTSGVWHRLSEAPFNTALEAVCYGISALDHTQLNWRWMPV